MSIAGDLIRSLQRKEGKFDSTIHKNVLLISPDKITQTYIKIFLEDDKFYLAYVPLELLLFSHKNTIKYNDALKQIQSKRNTRPILIDGFNKHLGRYVVGDGHHRCIVASDLGYTHIPAIVPCIIEDSEFIVLY
jgi:hypothetical protein